MIPKNYYYYLFYFLQHSGLLRKFSDLAGDVLKLVAGKKKNLLTLSFHVRVREKRRVSAQLFGVYFIDVCFCEDFYYCRLFVVRNSVNIDQIFDPYNKRHNQPILHTPCGIMVVLSAFFCCLNTSFHLKAQPSYICQTFSCLNTIFLFEVQQPYYFCQTFSCLNECPRMGELIKWISFYKERMC